MAGSLLLLLPFGFSSLPLPTEVFTSASVQLRSPMAIGPCRSAVYCWMLRRPFIHSVLFTHQAVKFLLTCKADDDNRACDSSL